MKTCRSRLNSEDDRFFKKNQRIKGKETKIKGGST